MKLWFINERRPLQPRERKCWIHRYVAMAETADDAIALVREAEEFSPRGGTWTAHEVEGPPCFGLGVVSSEATADEKRAQKESFR